MCMIVQLSIYRIEAGGEEKNFVFILALILLHSTCNVCLCVRAILGTLDFSTLDAKTKVVGGMYRVCENSPTPPPIRIDFILRSSINV